VRYLQYFDPNALPIAILDLPSRLDMIEINISGEDVAKPIKIKLDKK
jgi:LEA14-like dessication related protein